MGWVGELRVTGVVFSVPGLAVARGGVANDNSASLPLGAELHTRCPLEMTGMPYPVKKVCSFFYRCPLEHCTVFSNYLLDVQRTGNMGTSFFTLLYFPWWARGHPLI